MCQLEANRIPQVGYRTGSTYPNPKPGCQKVSLSQIPAKLLEVDENVNGARLIRHFLALNLCLEQSYSFCQTPKWVNAVCAVVEPPDHHYGDVLVICHHNVEHSKLTLIWLCYHGNTVRPFPCQWQLPGNGCERFDRSPVEPAGRAAGPTNARAPWNGYGISILTRWKISCICRYYNLIVFIITFVYNCYKTTSIRSPETMYRANVSNLVDITECIIIIIIIIFL